ncbi:SDR family oxidoreductase [Streptomyces sp. NPDC005566]|uniref:SDR family NAD(P)-dependent oxidoreductase n=1 Tax=Streptomyces sp. NPDC005566 TaxID=3156886 RepID=UPI0033AF6EE1
MTDPASPATPAQPLAGQVALVTGGGTGIGAGIALMLAGLGAQVVVNQPELSPPSGPYTVIPADVRDRGQVSRMFAQVHETFSRLDVLVNNAGIFPRADPLDLGEDIWDAVLDTNLKGAFFCAQEAARLMIPQRYGRIVNIASSAALTGSPRGAHYAASKAGMIGMGKSLARALARHRITVNTVAPGMTWTDQPGLDAQGFEEEGRKIPLGRVASPGDVAGAVAYLVGESGGYITGQTLQVNGGAVMLP